MTSLSTYAIGDVQGCLGALEALLDKIRFDLRCDRLWFVGDLVNRGPDSLEVLRFVKSLGDAAITVLGNHDLHLVARAEGFGKHRSDDTLEDVLAAPDCGELVAWLRHCPMLHAESSYVVVHAGLLPQWTVVRAGELAAEVETALRGPGYRNFLAELYGSRPAYWDDAHVGVDRLRVVVNAMTRMRFVSADGVMEFHAKGPPASAPRGCYPWFAVPGRRSVAATVITGHWSALGLVVAPNLLALDTGCVWGGQLSAVRLEDRQVFQTACPKD